MDYIIPYNLMSSLKNHRELRLSQNEIKKEKKFFTFPVILLYYGHKHGICKCTWDMVYVYVGLFSLVLSIKDTQIYEGPLLRNISQRTSIDLGQYFLLTLSV